MTGPMAAANALAVERLCAAEPVLVDVRPAIEVVPRFTPTTILTSGPPLPWEAYTGGQRRGILGGALFEGLANDAVDADAKLRDGRIRLAPCHDHGCVGSLAGIYTASMPVLVVENPHTGNRGFCNLFEGPSPARLNYGVYNENVRRSLLFIRDVVGPILGEAVRSAGGIALRPIIRRALHMGDELHSRNTAATLLFGRELFSVLLAMAERHPGPVRQLLEYLASDYVFLRLSMAASKVAADAAHGVEGSSVVTAMAFSCREFGIRVSGLADAWFRAPLPAVQAKLFPGYTEADIEFMGGESVINETVGLGGFAQAAAFALQDYQGGSAEDMVEMNRAMYTITLGEHPEFRIPYLGFRGVPVGIEIHRVVSSGIVPVMDIGVAGRTGGQIGAGVLRAPLGCFTAAADAYARRYRPVGAAAAAHETPE
ncbi:MAG: YahG/YlbE-like protein [Candidatus Rokuibacteriota bacterium]|nr:MAG: YahG/YlbE-like protein [Candidatus Rokubacteria bacterium]